MTLCFDFTKSTICSPKFYFEPKCLPVIKSSQAKIKVAFDDQFDNFEVILMPAQPDFKGKVEVVKQYFMVR